MGSHSLPEAFRISLILRGDRPEYPNGDGPLGAPAEQTRAKTNSNASDRVEGETSVDTGVESDF